MPKVNVPGVGAVNFPDSMSADDIQHAVEQDIIPQRNKSYAKPRDSYVTKLSSSDEAGFQKWVKDNNVPFDPSATSDYDMRGFYKGLLSGDSHAQTAVNQNDGKLHFSDWWKTPYHKSFSAESQYATDKAPRWNDQDQLVLPSGQVVYDERAGKPAPSLTEETAQSRPTPDAVQDFPSRMMQASKNAWTTVGKTGNYVYQGAANVINGAGQKMTALAQALGVPGADVKGYNAAVDQTNAVRAQGFRDAYGTDPSPLGDLAATIGVGSALNPSQTATSALGAIANGGRAGLVAGAASYNEGADTPGKNALWTAGGGVLGMLAGTVPAVFEGSKNLIRRYMTDPVEGAPAAMDKLKQFIPEMGDEATIGQQTGNVRTLKTESKLAEKTAQEQFMRQATVVKDKVSEIADKYGPMLPAEEAVRRGQLAMQNVESNMTNTRKALWNSDIDAIRTKLTADVFEHEGIQGTAQQLVEVPLLKDSLKQIAEDFTGEGTTLAPQIQKAIRELDPFKGSLSFDTLERLLQNVNGRNFNVLSGAANDAANRAAGAKMETAIMAALDSVDTNSEVGAMLKAARDGYSSRTTAIADFQNRAASKILGIDKNIVVSDPEAAFNRLLDLSPSEARMFKGVIHMEDPELLNSIRGAALRRAIDKATPSAAKPGAPAFDIDAFVSNTVKDNKLKMAGLFPEGDAKVLEENIRALAPLLNRASLGATPAEGENLVAAAVSGAGWAIARQAFKLLQAGTVEKVLFDPKARTAFFAAKQAVAGGKTEMAANILTRLANQYGPAQATINSGP